jgi:hypothetical protein
MTDWGSWGGTDSYCWAVICKNRKFHSQQNIYSGHKIPLGETDEFASPPALDFNFRVRCDECGAEHSYAATDLVRYQTQLAADFKPHPLFL